MQVSDLRLEIIKDYDAFIGQMGNVYFGLLAEAKDPTKTTMTKHWVDSFEKMHTQYQKHLELMKEINRIRIVANPL